MAAEPTTVIGLLSLVVSQVGMWIKIIVDGKKRNNGPMTEKRMEGLHKKVDQAEVKASLAAENSAKSLVAIESFKEHCASTSGGLAGQIQETRTQLFSHVSDHPK
jgi:hypothetical protein